MKQMLIKLIGLLFINIMLSMVLVGCGEVTLEEKTAKVQKANTIAVQDVIDLMELEGLEVTKLATDAELEKRWSDAVLLKVNENHYVALKSFEENLHNRKSVMREIGWQGGFGRTNSYPGESLSAVEYIGYEYIGYDTKQWIPSAEYCGKNIVALALPVYPENVAELSEEEQYALLEEISETSSGIQRVFYNDINGMITETIAMSSDNFTVEAVLYYYATGMIDESSKGKPVYYDARTWLKGSITVSDAIMEQYEGEQYKLKLEHPEGWKYGGGFVSTSSDLDKEDNQLEFPNTQTAEIIGQAPEGAPVYKLTIGDITETFTLEPLAE